jgi:fibro-slime domain-containing protein
MHRLSILSVAAGLAMLMIACGGSSSDTMTSASGGNGQGAANTGGIFNPTQAGGGGSGSGANNGCGNELVGVIRDFTSAHPDFEAELGTDKGIVENDLGTDLKPVYAGGSANPPTTHGQAAFDQWYRDTPNVNQPIPHAIQLTESSPGVFTFDDSDYFPIDGQGLGDEGNAHNYHFTYEIHAQFTYEGGEVFTFTGDDDLFTFINGKLAIDLGGVHGPQSQTIDLDQQAGALGIQVGETYSLDFFFAERHTSQSNFRIDTSIGCFTEVQPPS